MKRYKSIIILIVLLLPLIYYFKPFLFDNLIPAGVDANACISQNQLWLEWQKKTGETVLWNPNIFCGFPMYALLIPNLIHLDTLIDWLWFDVNIYWGFLYMLIGGFGIFFFLRYRKIQWYFALIVSVAFIMFPDWHSLLMEGHNSKVRALMLIPWMLLSFNYFLDKNNLLGCGLFAFVVSWIVRTHHWQIVFYSFLILLFLYTYPIISLLIQRRYKYFLSFSSKLLLATVLAGLTAAHPILTTHEYQKYTTRGGNAIVLEDSVEMTEGGVTYKYATEWSFPPSEVLDLILPHATGGITVEKYDGGKYTQLAGKMLPYYWGEKQSNGDYNTIGLLFLIFAICGVILYRRDGFVISITVFAVFTLLMSFGKYFPLYKLFYYYCPYFAKFRAPSMILNVFSIAIFLLAGYGFKALKSQSYKKILSLFAGGLGILAIVYLLNDFFGYIGTGEIERYPTQLITLLKDIRQLVLLSDIARALTVTVLATVGVYLYLKTRKKFIIAIIGIICIYPYFELSNRVYDNGFYQNLDKLETTTFRLNPISSYLKDKPQNSRAITLGQRFTDNFYSYYYPIINGYSAIKLQVIQDIMKNNLLGWQTDNRINWNIINMLGGKYIIVPQFLSEPFLEQITYDPERMEVLYENRTKLAQAWFVKNIRCFDDSKEIIAYMNNPSFHPFQEALLLNKDISYRHYYTPCDKIPLSESTKFDGEGIIGIAEKTPNSIRLLTESKNTQFLVLSETYYPNWIAKIDNQETEIYQTNHILRGIQVPAGKHTITFQFYPKTYYLTLTMIWIGNIGTLVIIFIGLWHSKKKLLTYCLHLLGITGISRKKVLNARFAKA